MMNTAIATRTNNIPLSVTYNVAIGVGRLKQTNKDTAAEVQSTAAFGQSLKIGIYKSLRNQGIISNHALMQLMQMQRSTKPCQ